MVKKLFTALLMLAVNFYFGVAAAGIAAALYTNAQGPLPTAASFGLVAAVVVLCLFYQIFRARFSWQSPGELAVGSSSKADLLIQSGRFSITRIPLFLLLLLTLALPSNFLDGIGDGQVYSLPQVFTIGLLYLGFYRGLDFFIRPGFAATAMFMGGLLLSAAMARGAGAAGGEVAAFFLLLAGLWLVAWLVYRHFYVPSPA